jgi:serine protease Do
MGVGVAEINAERAKALNLKEERGVEIKSVTEDGPAAKAGIKAGDVVLEYNGQRVEGMDQFSRLVRETPAGRNASLLVFRNGAAQSVTVTIGSRAGRTIHFGGEEGRTFTIPAIPPIPPMPDMPRSMMSWRSPMLGIESESLNTQLAEYFGVKDGVLVRSVIKDSSAEKAGIKAGDVIVKVDGTTVASPREISSVLRSIQGAKRVVPVVLVRDKKEMTVTITLEDEGRYRGVKAVAALIGDC